MFHPTMLLLSTINIDEFVCKDTVDYTHLQRSKEEILRRELDTLCQRLLSDEFLFADIDGREVAMETQFSGVHQISISRETALVLTRLREAAKLMQNRFEGTSYDDLNDDVAISRLEAIPNSVYSTVYNILSRESAAARNAKTGIRKLNELRKKILLYRNKESVEISSDFVQKIEDISTVGFWRTLLYHDYLLVYRETPNRITTATMTRIKEDLELLDIYGFVPPSKMMEAYNSTSINRKVSVTIEDFVVDFLTEVVRSGGIEI